jgi:Ca2+-binding RTX toxin-like protein
MTTFTVMNSNDSGAGSLREALANAEANGLGADTIVFDPSVSGQVIQLTSGQLSVSSGAVRILGDINGDGNADVTIQRSETNLVHSSVLLDVAAGTTVAIDSLVMRNADTAAIDTFAGIINHGTLTITDSVISGQNTIGTNGIDSAAELSAGGTAVSGIDNSGILTLKETVLENMTATGGIGAIDNSGFGTNGGDATSGILNRVGGSVNLDNVLFKNIFAAGGAGSLNSYDNINSSVPAGDGGNAFGGWQNQGSSITGDAGAHGILVFGGLGAVSFFSFSGADGHASTPATGSGFTLSPAASMVLTTSGGDYISGTLGADFIFGLTGNDTLFGFTGADQLFGGAGNDTLNGGDDGDTLYGWSGNDTLNGDDGADYLNGQVGNDALTGGAGNDRLYGGNGVDTLHGGLDNDFLSGENGDDVLHGDAGLDSLYGSAGNDSLYGGDDADKLYGGVGDDNLQGDAGNDVLSGGTGVDTLSGGTGSDTLLGDAGNDILNGGDDADKLNGGADNDTLHGDLGNDTLNGNDGADTLQGGADNDLLYGGAGADSLDGGTGNDRLNGGADADQFRFTGNGFGHDSISDFTAGIDTLVFDAGIFQDTNPAVTTAQQVLDTFGHMNAAGTLFTFNFGGGDVIDIKVTAGVSAATLVDDITIFT